MIRINLSPEELTINKDEVKHKHIICVDDVEFNKRRAYFYENGKWICVSTDGVFISNNNDIVAILSSVGAASKTYIVRSVIDAYLFVARVVVNSNKQ